MRDIEASEEPMVIDKPQWDLAKDLALRLLVSATSIHTDAGNHVKAYESWLHWARSRGLDPTRDSTRATRRFEKIVAQWPRSEPSELLPWFKGTT